jgi:hypothetical protein
MRRRRAHELSARRADAYTDHHMSNPATAESGHFHAVRFYKDASSLATIVCGFLAEGLKQGEPAVLIATREHVACFQTCFTASGIDVGAETARGMLTVLDAQETLDQFMRDGVPLAQPFHDTISPVLTAVSKRFPGKPIRAYGEMVDVLWKQDRTAAAIRLEALWNDLARSHTFKLLCGYAMGSFYKGSATADICAVHSHVISESGSHVSLQ